VIVVTGYGALWVARKVERAAPFQGFVVGLVVALMSFVLDLGFSGKIDPVGLVLYVLMVAAGWLGGILGSRRCAAFMAKSLGAVGDKTEILSAAKNDGSPKPCHSKRSEESRPPGLSRERSEEARRVGGDANQGISAVRSPGTTSIEPLS
jgi:hypothetical protein